MYNIVKHQNTESVTKPHTWIEGDTLNITEGENRWSEGYPMITTVFLNTRELVAVHTGYNQPVLYSPKPQAFVFFVNGVRRDWDKLTKSQRDTITATYNNQKELWWIRLPKKKWQPRITVEQYIENVNSEITAGWYGNNTSRSIANMFGVDYNASSEYIGFWSEYLEDVETYEVAISVLADAMATNVANTDCTDADGEEVFDADEYSWLKKDWGERTWVRIAEAIWGGAVEKYFADKKEVTHEYSAQ